MPQCSPCDSQIAALSLSRPAVIIVVERNSVCRTTIFGLRILQGVRYSPPPPPPPPPRMRRFSLLRCQAASTDENPFLALTINRHLATRRCIKLANKKTQTLRIATYDGGWKFAEAHFATGLSHMAAALSVGSNTRFDNIQAITARVSGEAARTSLWLRGSASLFGIPAAALGDGAASPPVTGGGLAYHASSSAMAQPRPLGVFFAGGAPSPAPAAYGAGGPREPPPAAAAAPVPGAAAAPHLHPKDVAYINEAMNLHSGRWREELGRHVLHIRRLTEALAAERKRAAEREERLEMEAEDNEALKAMLSAARRELTEALAQEAAATAAAERAVQESEGHRAQAASAVADVAHAANEMLQALEQRCAELVGREAAAAEAAVAAGAAAVAAAAAAAAAERTTQAMQQALEQQRAERAGREAAMATVAATLRAALEREVAEERRLLEEQRAVSAGLLQQLTEARQALRIVDTQVQAALAVAAAPVVVPPSAAVEPGMAAAAVMAAPPPPPRRPAHSVDAESETSAARMDSAPPRSAAHRHPPSRWPQPLHSAAPPANAPAVSATSASLAAAQALLGLRPQSAAGSGPEGRAGSRRTASQPAPSAAGAQRRGGKGSGGAGAKRRRGGDDLAADEAGEEGGECRECGATTTPTWREGPHGPKTLCNACGVRWMRAEKKWVGGKH